MHKEALLLSLHGPTKTLLPFEERGKKGGRKSGRERGRVGGVSTFCSSPVIHARKIAGSTTKIAL